MFYIPNEIADEIVCQKVRLLLAIKSPLELKIIKNKKIRQHLMTYKIIDENTDRNFIGDLKLK